MNCLLKKCSAVLGSIALSALLASTVLSSAFAADPTYRDAPGEYTETVKYDPKVTTASTEVSIDTSFHYLDYSPEIDITYKWSEDLEWIYIKNGKYGFWLKGYDKESAWDFVKKAQLIQGIDSFDDWTDRDWERAESLYGDILTYHNCVTIEFENHASTPVDVGLEPDSVSWSSTTIDNKPYPAESAPSDYLLFRAMKPNPGEDTVDFVPKYYDETFTTTRLNTDTIKDYDEVQGNQALVGINPHYDYRPPNYQQWIPENRKLGSIAGRVIEAQLKLTFTKVDE